MLPFGRNARAKNPTHGRLSPHAGVREVIEKGHDPALPKPNRKSTEQGKNLSLFALAGPNASRARSRGPPIGGRPGSRSRAPLSGSRVIRGYILPLAAVIVASAIFQLSNGALQTLLPVRLGLVEAGELA